MSDKDFEKAFECIRILKEVDWEETPLISYREYHKIESTMWYRGIVAGIAVGAILCLSTLTILHDIFHIKIF